MNTFKRIYLLLLIAVFTFASFSFTHSWYPEDGFGQLTARLGVGGFFIVLGFIFMRFRQNLGSLFYERQIEIVKKRTSVENLVEGWKYGGTFMLSTGGSIIIIGLIAYITQIFK